MALTDCAQYNRQIRLIDCTDLDFKSSQYTDQVMVIVIRPPIDILKTRSRHLYESQALDLSIVMEILIKPNGSFVQTGLF